MTAAGSTVASNADAISVADSIRSRYSQMTMPFGGYTARAPLRHDNRQARELRLVRKNVFHPLRPEHHTRQVCVDFLSVQL
jgi:hypothetical protein